MLTAEQHILGRGRLLEFRRATTEPQPPQCISPLQAPTSNWYVTLYIFLYIIRHGFCPAV
ncbi:MAG: hypothetical protein KME17_06750 [Cyanosarcina radialis HA8281-LM2]|nr:hypothetical protein [Cyanosarcina radialis HA8281-LM2]